MLLAALALTLSALPPPIRFREHTVTDGLKSGYQIVVADINGDGKPDLIAVDSGSSEIAWYENPGWERHVIATGVPHPINLAAAGGNIVLLYQFDMDPSKSIGIVAVLHPDGDVRNPWTLREIDRVPSAHRVRFSDGAFILAPLAGATAKPPDYDAAVPIYLYRPPAWKRELLTGELRGVLHGIHAGEGELITASFLGVRIFAPPGKWDSREIGRGDPAPCPRCGSSDVAPGRAGGHRFIAAIEPWHGNQVAVYRESKNGWERKVVDTSLDDGHALATADLDGDGNDEIVAGCRGKNHQVYLYSSVDGVEWNRTILDPGMAAANCAIRDLNGDGRPDVICIGASTHNIKWYENLGK